MTGSKKKVVHYIFTPYVREIILLGIWFIWYGGIGPFFFSHHPWGMLDLVRPWFILQVQIEMIHPVFLFWLGALWGVFQDVYFHYPIGFYGLIWGVHVFLMYIFKQYMNLLSFSGLGLYTLTVVGTQYVSMFFLSFILDIQIHGALDWISADFLLTWLMSFFLIHLTYRTREVFYA